MAIKLKKGITIPLGIVVGVLASIILTIVGALIVTNFVLKERIDIESVGTIVFFLLVAASALGAWLGAKLVSEKKLLASGLTGLGFFLVLLSINAVFFDGMFAGVGITALAILAGIGISLLPKLRKKSSKSKIKIPAYR